MKKKYRNIAVMITGAALLLTVLIGCLTPQSVPVTIATAGIYKESIKAEGVLYAPIRWDLYAPEMLLVKGVHVREGDYVMAGQLLAELDDDLIEKQLKANQNALKMQLTTLQAELSAATSQRMQYSPQLREKALASLSSQLDSRRIALNNARRDYENAAILYSDGFIPRIELDAAAGLVSQAESGVLELQAAYDSTRVEMETMWDHYGVVAEGLESQIALMEALLLPGETDAQSAQLAYLAGQTQMTAPFSGKVLSVNIRPGQLADGAQPAISLYDESEAALLVYLPAADAAAVYPGMEVEVKLDDKAKTIVKGTVMTVSSQAVERMSALGILESRVKAEISLMTDEPLIIGQKLDGEFILKQVEAGIAVPKACVFPYEDGYGVMTVEKGRACLVPFEKDFETDTMVIAASGLAEGDAVILTPAAAGLKEGKRIKADYR